MNASSGAIRTALSAGALLTVLVSQASACGDLTGVQPPLTFMQQALSLRVLSARSSTPTVEAAGQAAPSIVGMWNVQYLAQGNLTHNPPIGDGTMVDWGYSQWHSDGTEILNSGGHTPGTENFCLGVWGRTGYLTYELNHFALSYDFTSQTLAAYVNIREHVTLSPSGDMYTGTFTIDVYDPKGNHIDHIAGNVNGQRITVDSVPSPN